MKIETDSVYVNLISENNFDVFHIGQLSSVLHKQDIDSHTKISEELTKIQIKKEDFIKFLLITIIK